jgi:UPF0176 protein
MEKQTHKVLLFYKYVKLENPQEIVLWQKQICNGTEIKGRVLIGIEGINGTVSGTDEEMAHYIAETIKDPRFSDIDFKESYSDVLPFPKLKIKARKEIVTLNLEDDVDIFAEKRGTYLEPDSMYELLQSGEEFYIVDARNSYESKIGKFKDAITPEIENFREFPEFLKELEHLKDKKVVFYCTGGIRCEKASTYAIKQGFENVYQLHGGIQRFAEKYPKAGFEGSMYVFDNRIGIAFDKDADRTILTECMFCEKACDEYKNCYNAKCNARIIACDDCYKENEGCCSDDCRKVKHGRKVKFRFEEKL